jgi:hypothetical protein
MTTDDADNIAYNLAIVSATVAQQAPALAGLLREASRALTEITTERDLLRQPKREKP